MFYTRLVVMLATAIFMGMFTGTSAADHKSSKVKLPALKVISPVSGATIENPVVVIFETEADLSKMTRQGTHTIRVYWADPRHHRALSNVQTVRITLK